MRVRGGVRWGQGSGSVVGEEVVGRLLVLVSLSGRVMERVWGRLGAVGGILSANFISKIWHSF